MPRKLREDYEGAWHHVMNRGIDRATVFSDNRDRSLFLELLGQAILRTAVEVHAYCLMGNHYHLLMYSREGRLSECMKWLSGRFTQRVNYRDGRDGPLFRGRFASVAIETDAQLVQVSRYIHLNPVEAGLVVDAAEWRWSSARAYLEGGDNVGWLQTSMLLDMFGPQAPRRTYRAFIAAGVDAETAERYRTFVPGADPQGQTPVLRVPKRT